MQSFEKLLLENKAWAAETLQDDPEFFERLQHVQTPEFLWIGCSDSRVPANEITGTLPGEIFVHRNIANLVVEDDINVLSVLEYAVAHLKVKHIIVCGHHNCGGVKAAMTNHSYGIIDKWIINIKNVYDEFRDEIDTIEKEEDRVNRLVECNVRQQVINLSKTETIRKAWEHERRPYIHGWVYGLGDGLLKPVFTLTPPIKQEEPAPYHVL
ncbi:MAG: carbonic anhydrase [Candidatus Pseudobacter hemicellulosilyticus]|uniref:Carbonic anhydrase n=1 Tax=Candidatus Pseudobacter hemicellulosilyticus TaxID=3121375 RepID=A0AAJ5WUZ5_9BACT|nr:MAG: carbonic anhydrase [Pseudobacter sp.]